MTWTLRALASLGLALLTVACEPYPEEHPCREVEPFGETDIQLSGSSYLGENLWGEVSVHTVPVTFDAPLLSFFGTGRIADGLVSFRVLGPDGAEVLHTSLSGRGPLGDGAVDTPAGEMSFLNASTAVATGEGVFEVRHSYACGSAQASLVVECPGDEHFWGEGGCTDGVDGDCDGLTDCEDTDSCGWDPACQ